MFGTASVRAWHWVGFAVAIIIGSLGAVFTKTWIGIAVAAALGLTAGAGLVEYSRPSDVHVDFFHSFASGVRNCRHEILWFSVAATAGALASRVFRKSPSRPQR